MVRETQRLTRPLGCPSRFIQHKSTIRVQKSDTSPIHDSDQEQYPNAPAEPALHAILHQRPYFSTADVDIFGCGNTLTNLLCFAKGEARDFVFLVERIGSTTFFVRQSSGTGQQPRSGYSQDFLRMFTKWDDEVEGSISHHRVVRYEFADLKCVVKSECDAYLEDVPTDTVTNDCGQVRNTEVRFAGLIVKDRGRSVPQTQTIKIETRSIFSQRPRFTAETISKLWVRHMTHVMVAQHHHGYFAKKDCELKNCKREITEWEQQHQRALSKYADILRKLVEISQVPGQTRFMVERNGEGPLRIRPTGSRCSALSERVKESWLNKHEDEHSSIFLSVDTNEMNAQDMYT